MENLTLEILALLFFAGLAGGFVDSIAGGGGLITVPVLLSVGLAPVDALATNKGQAMFGSFTAMRTYAKKGHVNLGDMKWAMVWSFTGSVIATTM